MSGKTFVDSNILIYAHDIDQGEKHLVSKAILEDLIRTKRGVLSPQVLQEFYVVVTRKLARPLNKHSARDVVSDFSIWCIEVSATEVASAFRIEDEARISFWDALICASAAKAGAHRILSEDMNHGQKIAGILIENPFLAAR